MNRSYETLHFSFHVNSGLLGLNKDIHEIILHKKSFINVSYEVEKAFSVTLKTFSHFKYFLKCGLHKTIIKDFFS